MKKILCLVLIIIMLLTCVGCSTVPEGKASDETSMFVRVETGSLVGYSYNIVYHKDTKVMYAVSYESIFTVMLDADGKPLLWER